MNEVIYGIRVVLVVLQLKPGHISLLPSSTEWYSPSLSFNEEFSESLDSKKKNMRENETNEMINQSNE